MIAIPTDATNFGIKSSTLFGNAPTFALYNRSDKTFIFKENEGCGNGIKTAKTLKSWGVNSVVYSFLGDGPFTAMIQNGITIYYIGKEPIGLKEIIDGLEENTFIQVDTSNAALYLHPGTHTQNCECGGGHE